MNHVVVLCTVLIATVGCSTKSEQQGAPAPAPAPAQAPAPAAAPDPVPAPTADPAPAADAALLAATKAYVDKNAAKGMKYDLELQAVEGDHARFAVKPQAQNEDGAIVFMRRKGGKWAGFDMGTSIACADLEKAGFPEKVRTGCD